MKSLQARKRIENKIHRLLGRFSFSTYIAVKIRNQANCVIAYHLGDPNPKKNGEYLLLESLRGRVKTFIDVGSNRGEWSQMILDYGAECGWCFEPSSQCASFLKNRFQCKNIKIRELALSDKQSTQLFHEEPDFGATSSLGIRSEHKGSQTREVTVTTLDDEFQDSDLVVDFLKTDCEGWDLKALQGAAQLLKRTKYVQFEYNSYWLKAGSSLREAIDFLESLDFAVFLINGNGLHSFEYDFYGDFFRYSNFFACKKSDSLYSKLKLVPEVG